MTTETTTTTIPAGWKLVPRVPTEAMISAGLKEPVCSVDPHSFARSAAFCQYQGMVEAAPAAPSPAPAAPSAAQWMPIETAPKFGWDVPILTCRMGQPETCFDNQPVGGYAEPPEAAYWNQDGDCWTPIQRPHDVWLPTHWMPLPAAPGAQPAPALEFGYTNWRGEYARRRVQPIRTFFGSTEWHPKPQWLLEATDLDKGEVRAFAVKDMVFGAQPAQGGSVTETLQRIANPAAWSAPEPDSEASNVMAQIIAEMRRIASGALSAARASAPAAPEVVEAVSRRRRERAEYALRVAANMELCGKNIVIDAGLPTTSSEYLKEGAALIREFAALRAAGEEANG